MVDRRDFMVRGMTGLGAAAMTSSGTGAAQARTASLNVIYPNHDGARFDIAYYRATHIPLAMKVMKADKVLLTEGLPTNGAPPPYVMICSFQFASPEALQAAMAEPGMAEVRANVAVFTDITPAVMLGRSS